MTLLALLIGTGMTTLVGWLALGLIEGKNRVLSIGERLAFGLTVGPTVSMFTVFIAHVLGLVSLNLAGFLVPQILLIAALSIGAWKRGTWTRQAAMTPFVPVKRYPRRISLGVAALCVWTALKIAAGSYDLVSVPTYWDDSFNNWNMRGKMFFVTQELTLDIPIGNGVTSGSEGVSSYPPMLPMMKTWLAVLRGVWSEPLINGVHLLWFFGLLLGLYCTVRRYADPLIAALVIWAFVSLPLVVIHASNPYADIFVAAHVLCAVAALLGLLRSQTAQAMRTWTLLFCLALGSLALTKNEALILHVPLLVLAGGFSIHRNKTLVTRQTLALGVTVILTFVLPWLVFKWTHGLSFGNAKSVSGVTLGFNPLVLKAIWFHLTHEPNWLLLPLTMAFALLAAGKRFWKTPEAMLGAVVLADIALQLGLFVMVQSLATEAINQTGLSRGLLQIMPATIVLLFFALRSHPNAAAAADNSASSAVILA